MHLTFELVVLLTLGNLCTLACSSFISFWRDRDIRKAVHLCPKRWELMGAVRAGGPLRSLVQPNQTIVLQCRFCEDPEETEDDDDIGMWTFVDIVHGSAPIRVPRRMGPKETKGSFLGFGRKPRLVQTDDRSLAMRKPRTTDLGLYECRRNSDNSSFGSTVRFVIDMDIASYEWQLNREREGNLDEKDDDTEDNDSTDDSPETVKDDENMVNEAPYVNGTFAEWPSYRKSHLVSLEKVTALSNLHLEAISEWSSWTQCEHCWSTKYGVRARRGVCVLRLPLHGGPDDDVIAKELAGLPALACRSALLSLLHPRVGRAARKVPDFVELDYRGCNGQCSKNDSKSHGSLLHRLVYLFRHRRDAPLLTHKRLTINAGETLVIVCPDATAETPVQWEKDGEAIGGGSGGEKTIHKRNPVQRIITELRQGERWIRGAVAGIKAEPENTPIVDAAGVLKVPKAAPRNTGSYVCSVNGTPRGTFQVEVIARSTLSFDDVMRHFAYVSLVLLSCIMIWCGVIICVSLRERLRKRKYTKLPQSTSPNLDTSDSRPESPRSDEDLVNAEKSKKKTKHRAAQQAIHPSRKSSRAVEADSPGPPTASYHKAPSRLRIRHLSRIISPSSASNNDMELVRLLPSIRPAPRRQQSSVTSSDVEDRGPVVVLSQQLFPASQRTLRPPPPVSPQARQCRSSVGIQVQADLEESAGSWIPSAISASVLRARNSSRRVTAGSSPSIFKGANATLQQEQASSRVGAGTGTVRVGARKKPRNRQKWRAYGKPRKSRSQWKKHRGMSSSAGSSAKSPVRKKPAFTRPKCSPRQASLNRFSYSHSRLSASPKPANSPVPDRSRSPGKTSPRLSLLYKALPSPKLASSSVSRELVSSVSFLSNSAGNSTADQDISVGREKTIEPTRSEAIVPAEESNKPDRIDRNKSLGGLSPAGFSVKTLALDDQTSSASKKLSAPAPVGDLLPKPDLLSITSRTSPQTQPYSQCNLPPQDSKSQQSMFEIKNTGEKPTKPLFPEFPPFLSRQSSRGPTQQIELCESLEQLKLVAAAFLEAQKKSVTPRSSLNQGKVEKLSPQTSQGPFLMPPAIPVASPRRSEISLSLPVKPSCDANSAVSVPQPTRQKSSKTFSRRKTPLQSKPSLHSTATKVSRQLLPALISPCAIALTEHSPVNKLLKTPEGTSPRAKKFKPAVKTGMVPSSMSSARSSASTQAVSTLTTVPKAETKTQRSVSFSNTDSVSRQRVPVPLEALRDDEHSRLRDRVPCSDTKIRPKTPVRDPAFLGKPADVRKAESVTLEASKYADHVRETRSEDAFSRGSPTRFRTFKPETECGSTHSDWIAAHHKAGVSKERVRFSDTVTTLRKMASTRYSKHKGFFVRQKPEVDKFQIILVDTDKLKESVPSVSQSREPLSAKVDSKTLSRSALLDSMTPATAIALPQRISAQPVRPANPPSQLRVEPQRIASQPHRSEPIHIPEAHPTSQESTRLHSKESIAVPKKPLATKPVRSKQSTYRIRTRMRKTSHVTMSTITDPLEFKFKGGKHDSIPHLRPTHPQCTSFGFLSGLDRGFAPYALGLKLTQSLPHAAGSPSFSKLFGHPETVSKSLGEVEAKAPMKLLTPKPSRSRAAYLKSPSEDSRFASQLLAKEPTPVSSHTTQVEKGDIDNGTCDAEVQSVMRSYSSEQGVDEATSFGSLGESRRVPLATAEMASQVSDIRTTAPPRPSPRLQPFPLRSKLPALVRSTNPLRNEVIKGRVSKPLTSETPSRLPIPVKKKSVHRIKPEARAKSSVQKAMRTRTVRKPPVLSSKQDSELKSLRPNPLETVPLKSGILRTANKNDQDATLQDYDSHHVFSQTQIAGSVAGEVKPEAMQCHASSGALVDPPAFSVEVKPEPTDATQGIASITRTVSPVTPESTGLRSPSTATGEMRMKEGTVVPSVESDSQSLKTTLNQKTRRNPIRRPPASVPRSLKIESSARRKSPDSPTVAPDVFVFGGRKQSRPAASNQCTPPNPPRRTECTLVKRTLLKGVRRFTNDIQEEQCPDFLEDEYMSVRGIPNVPCKRKQ